jgi:hypothetical protein
MEYKVAAFGGSYMGRAEVGPVDKDGVFYFGRSAELSWSKASFGQDGYEVKVNFPAIGSHDADEAVIRLRSYELAIKLARWVEAEIDARGVNGIGLILEQIMPEDEKLVESILNA